MKKFLLLLFLVSINLYAQENGIKTDSIINNHLQEFRKLVGKDAVIFIEFRYDFTKVKMMLSDNDLILLAGIEKKNLKKNVDYFLIRFLFYNDGKTLRLNGANFRVKRMKGDNINLINLSNGNDYEL
ncbi:MAG: hypothetical protein V4581_07230 [Bacteroidota bacterium]